jgi:hypothetical protein
MTPSDSLSRDPTLRPPPRRRRRIPVSVWGFFGSLGVICIARGLWVMLQVGQYDAKLEEIERFGGSVYRSPGPPAELGSILSQWPENRWLAPRLVHATQVRLTGSQFTDGGLKLVSTMSEVEALYLNDTSFSDGGLVHLNAMPKLGWLKLENTQITDAGLETLGRHPSLRALLLGNTQITDLGLAQLRRLPLILLAVEDTQVTDAGLAHLAGFTTLWELRLDGTRITDAGLVHLEEMPSLRSVSLNNTEISDAGVVHLANMPLLDRIFLMDTKVTTAGLMQFKGQSRPVVLQIRNTQVPDEDVARLRRALPLLRVVK